VTQPSPESQLADLRGLVTSATQRLLGATIAVSDGQWSAPSRLPGWSRAHVATHLARQADGLVRLVEGAEAGERRSMYASFEAREAEIEAGARRTGLELQTDLDTSAGRLTEAFERLDETGEPKGSAWSRDVEMRGGLVVPARLLPLGRLFEVELHLVDLDVGHDVEDVGEPVAAWLVEWVSFRARARDEFPRIALEMPSGTTTVGSVGEPLVVRGTAAACLGWLTGRSEPDAVEGAGGLRVPSL
jgi:maleylpyruvate isomerase